MQTRTRLVVDGIEQAIVDLIDNASTSVLVVVAWFKNENLYTALLRASYRKVSVYVCLLEDEINFGDNSLNFSDLVSAGGNVYLLSPDVKMLHHKFCVIDDAIAITGSYNWTNKANYNRENVIISEGDKNLCRDFNKEFASIARDATIYQADYTKNTTTGASTLDAIAWWNGLTDAWRIIFSTAIRAKPNSISIEGINNVLKLEEIRILDAAFLHPTPLPLVDLITNFDPLKALVKLRKLVLKAKLLSDLGFLTDFPLLKEVEITSDNLKYGDSITKNESIRSLSISSPVFKNIAFVSKMKHLESIGFIGAPALDFASLLNHPSLTRVAVIVSEVKNLHVLASVKQLRELYLSSAKFDLRDLLKINQVVNLGWNGNGFFDIKLIEQMTGLTNLHINTDKQVYNFDALENLKNIRVLTLGNIEANCLKHIGELRELKSLVLYEGNDLDLSYLLVLKGLAYLSLGHRVRLKRSLSSASASVFAKLSKSPKDFSAWLNNQEINAFKVLNPDCKVE